MERHIDRECAKQSVNVIYLALQRIIQLDYSPASIRVARSVIEGQLTVLAEVGLGGEPSEADLLEVAGRR